MSHFALAKKAMLDARVSNKWFPSDNNKIGVGGSNVMTGFVSVEGTVSTPQFYPCHAPIFQFKNASVLWSAFGWRGTKEAAEYYFNWLIHESPWSKTGIIPDLDDEFMFKEGFIFVNLHKTPANLLHNFLVASRASAEWPNYIVDWYSIVKEHKINPALVYVYMTLFTPINSLGNTCLSKGNVSTISVIDKYDWPLDVVTANEEYVVNFLKGKTVGLSQNPFSPTAMTKPVNSLWGMAGKDVGIKDRYSDQIKTRYSGYSTNYELKQTLQIGNDLRKPGERIPVFSDEAIFKIMKLEQERLFG